MQKPSKTDLSPYIASLRQADLNLLVVFAVLGEERNVSRAGARLLLGQSAISRALQRLREMFHDDLLVRSGSNYMLTPQGNRLFDEVKVILPTLGTFLVPSRFDPNLEKKHFRIAAADNATSLLAPILGRDVFPRARKIQFDFAAWEEQCFDALSSGYLDLVLNADEGWIPAQFERETIYEERLCCVVSADSKHTQGFTLKEYLNADHISVNVFGSSQEIPEKRLAAMGKERKIVMSVPYFSSAMRAVVGSNLVATMPLHLVESEPQDSRLKILPAPDCFTGFNCMMFWQSSLNSDAAHRWLRQTIKSASSSIGFNSYGHHPR